MEHVKFCLTTLKTKYFNLAGRAGLREYWSLVIFYYAVFFILLFLAMLLALIGGALLGEKAAAVVAAPIVALIVLLAFGLLPALFTAFIRRLHDTGRSAWWALIALVPFGLLVLVVFTFLDSQLGENRYGPNPKGLGGSAAGDVFV